jgi:exonuclease III
MADNIKILSLNLNGIAKAARLNRVITELSLSSADVIFLQETHLHSNLHLETARKLWGGVSLWDKGTPGSCGVAILFKKNVNIAMNNVQLSGCGRFIAVDCVINGLNLRLVNIYAPTKELPRRAFLTPSSH